MYERMLVSLDGSTLSDVLIDYATKLAALVGIEAVMLNVLPTEDKALMPMHQAYVEKAAEKVLSCNGKKAISARGEVVIGNPVDAIKKYTRKHKVDFILMATHGRSGFSRLAIGSVADALLRESAIPIWLIRAGISEKKVKDASPEGRVLVLLDGTKKAEASLPHVETLAQQLGTELTEVVLVSVCSEPEVVSDYPANMPLSWDEHVAAEKVGLRQEMENYLRGILERMSAGGIKVNYEILTGEPHTEIIRYTANSNFSLIVMATHARSGFSRWAFGSVAEKVLTGVTVPVLLVRAR